MKSERINDDKVLTGLSKSSKTLYKELLDILYRERERAEKAEIDRAEMLKFLKDSLRFTAYAYSNGIVDSLEFGRETEELIRRIESGDVENNETKNIF